MSGRMCNNECYIYDREGATDLQQCQLSHVSQSVWEASNELIVRQKPIFRKEETKLCVNQKFILQYPIS